MLVESDLLSLNETLGDIFTDSEAWGGVIDEETIDFRKNVTIEDMLTMSSGLIDPPLPDEVMDPSFVMTDEMLEADFVGGQVGGANLTHSLGLPNIGTKGEFSYLAASNIMSYVIQTRSGLSPREYLSANVMQKLNIGEDEYGWEQNADGVELGYHGLELTPLQMAKFGQLYLQEGQYKEDNYLVSKSWVEDSLTTHAVNPETQSGYGYLFWNIGPYSCAMGFLGQDICIDPDTERVVVQQRDADYENILAGNYIMTPIALDPSLSFDSSDKTIAESPTISEETVAESPTVAPTKGVIQTDCPTSASSSGTSLTVLQMTSLCIALLIAKFL